MTDRAQQAQERAQRRREGPTPKQTARIQAHHFTGRDDLYTTCQGCGEQRIGTLDQLKQPCECGHGRAS